MTKRRWAVLLAAVVALPLLGATSSQATDQSTTSVSYPAYHRVQRGETLWSIARDFLAKAQDKRVTKVMTKHEVQQIEILNKDKVKDPNTITPGGKLLLATSGFDIPDGEAGWGTGFTGCREPRMPTRSEAPYRGLTVSVRLANPPVDRARDDEAIVTVRNESSRTRSFDLQDPDIQLFGLDGTPRGAVPWSDAIGVRIMKMTPGDVERIHATVPAYRCGDTEWLTRRLAPGHYDLIAKLRWSIGRHDDGRWVSAPNEVRVTS